jgi:hypothetical protein
VLLRRARGAGALAVALALLAAISSGCPSPDPNDGGAGGGGASGEAAWQDVFAEGALDRAVLSIWGTSSKSVYAVGGPLGNDGFETLAIHYDGKAWKDLHPGGAETFWWTSGSSDSDVWMVGEKGRISHWDGASFTAQASGTTSTLWGVMAFAPDDAWAVGGMPEGTSTDDDDVVLRWDGTSWAREALPGAPLHRALFKVWGTSDDDLYVVGELGVLWHRTAAGWKNEADPPLSSGTIFTVAGCGANEVYAVGGQDLLKSDGSMWSKVDVTLTNGANGVACASPGNLAIVGFGGLKRRLSNGTWSDDLPFAPHGDLHSVWADETGSFWAAGGDFISKPKPNVARTGTIARFGKGKISSKLE